MSEVRKMTLVFKGGCDLTVNSPCIMDIASCIAARYDAGIVPHQREHTGVIEIWRIEDERDKSIRHDGLDDGSHP